MGTCRVLAIAGASLLMSGMASAGPEKFASKGYIDNDRGEPCSFTQTITPDALYFHGDAISTTIGEIVFDDPQCMRDSGDGLDANRTLINELVATWYSHPDADFETKKLRNFGLYQEVGKCMQSRSYAAIAIAIDYVVEDGSIVKVVHGPTLEGCID